MSLVRRIGDLLRGTPAHTPVSAAYGVIEPYVESINDRLAGEQYGKEGWYRVETRGESFWIYLTGTGELFRNRIRGAYEPEVHDRLEAELSAAETFWEVGAAWGYFSCYAAQRCESVTAFEMQSELAGYIEDSAERNGLDNITVVEGAVGDDVDLTAFDPPDIALVDIEGWEYEMFAQYPELLDGSTTWIIEIHEDSSYTVGEPTIDPAGVLKMLENAGYVIEEVDSRMDTNYHILARSA
jgi:hypothetical protein